MRTLLSFTLAVIAVCSTPSLAREATEADAMKVAQKVSQKTLGPKHQRIEIVKVADDQLTFNLWYSDMPSSYAEVERDTKGVVAYAKKAWLDEGLDVPQFIFQVACRGFKDEGNDRVRTMGTAYWSGQNITFSKR